MFHGKISHRALLHNYLQTDLPSHPSSTAPFLCTQSCSQLDAKLKKSKSALDRKTTSFRTDRQKQSSQRQSANAQQVMAVPSCPKRFEGSWLDESEPAEAIFLKSLKRSEAKCLMRTQLSRMGDAARDRFFAMRKTVLEHQRSLLRGFDQIHRRTMDLGLIYAEQFLLQKMSNEVSDSNRPRAPFCTGARPGGGQLAASARLDDRDSTLSSLGKELSLLANVALWISCKYEEVQPPLVDVFLKRHFDEFYSFEMTMCQVLHWKFNHVTSSDYLSFFMASEGVKGGDISIERLITDLVQESDLWFQHPLLELIVASIVVGGAYIGDERLMISANVISVSGVERDSLVACLDDLHDFMYEQASSKKCYGLVNSRFPGLPMRIKQWKPSEVTARSAAEERFDVWCHRSRALHAANMDM